MTNTILKVRPVWTACCLLALCSGQTTLADTYPPGKKRLHPPLVLWSIEGDSAIAVDSYHGTKLLLIHFSTSPQCHAAVEQWRDACRKLSEESKIAVVGVMHEQHRDRCKLFAQWKNITFPIMHDPLNLAPVSKLPIAVGLDRDGVVRLVESAPNEQLQAFIDTKFRASKRHRQLSEDFPSPRYTLRMAGEARDSKGWRTHGDALMLGGLPPQLEEAIITYEKAIKLDSSDPLNYFRLGAAHFTRFERAERQPGDFQAAIDAWRLASRNGKKHRWLKRCLECWGTLEQRSASPYGWILTARSEIAGRGETPTQLTHEPTLIELAEPRKKFVSTTSFSSAPPTDASAIKDSRNVIEFEPVIVPGKRTKKYVYYQLLFVCRPGLYTGATWDNTGEPLRVWLEQAKGVHMDRQLAIHPTPDAASTNELRILHIEVRHPRKAKLPIELKGRTAYSISANGSRQRLRRDFVVTLNSRE